MNISSSFLSMIYCTIICRLVIIVCNSSIIVFSNIIKHFHNIWRWNQSVMFVKILFQKYFLLNVFLILHEAAFAFNYEAMRHYLLKVRDNQVEWNEGFDNSDSLLMCTKNNFVIVSTRTKKIMRVILFMIIT